MYSYLSGVNRLKTHIILLGVYCSTTLTLLAQGSGENRHTLMRSTTQKLLEALANSDTAALVNMLDTGYNQLNKPGARKYFSEDALLKCEQYKKITAAFTMPPLDSLQLATNKTTHNTICILPLTGLPNNTLNIRKCVLAVSFYPAKLFSMQVPGQYLGFYFDITPMRKPTQGDTALQR